MSKNVVIEAIIEPSNYFNHAQSDIELNIVPNKFVVKETILSVYQSLWTEFFDCFIKND